MKRFQNLFIISLLASLSFISCQKISLEEAWSAKAIKTISVISGDYTMISATWSSPIDLSGEGTVSNDILQQLKMYGWMGNQSVKYSGEEEFTSALYRSAVLSPRSPRELAQVNLNIPLSEWIDRATGAPVKNGRCDVDMTTFQFHYTVDPSGDITLHNVMDRTGGDAPYRKLEHIKIHLDEAGYLLFEADATFYDWATASWQDGHMSLIYWHN